MLYKKGKKKMEKRYDIAQIYADYIDSKNGKEMMEQIADLMDQYNQCEDLDEMLMIFMEIGKHFFMGGLLAGAQVTMDLIGSADAESEFSIEREDLDPHQFS